VASRPCTSIAAGIIWFLFVVLILFFQFSRPCLLIVFTFSLLQSPCPRDWFLTVRQVVSGIMPRARGAPTDKATRQCSGGFGDGENTLIADGSPFRAQDTEFASGAKDGLISGTGARGGVTHSSGPPGSVWLHDVGGRGWNHHRKFRSGFFRWGGEPGPRYPQRMSGVARRMRPHLCRGSRPESILGGGGLHGITMVFPRQRPEPLSGGRRCCGSVGFGVAVI
jgi:hypothetical protein